MEINLNNLKTPTWVMLILVFAFAVCSSFLFIYTFNKELFFKTELIKLLLLGLSFTLPLWVINNFFWAINAPANIKTEFQIELGGISSSVMLFPVIYSPILVKCFCDISLKEAIVISISIQLLIIALFLIYNSLTKKIKGTKG